MVGLDQLLSDPAVISRLGELAKTVGPSLSKDLASSPEPGQQDGDSSASAAVDDSTPNEAENTASQDEKSGKSVRDPISALLSNPQLLAKLPQIIELLTPLLGTLSKNTEQSSAGPDQAIATGAHPQRRKESGSRHCVDKRVALLCALKPYMDERRAEAIDYIVSLDKISGILSSLT